MVIFMVASLLLLAAVATPRVLTEGSREKEAELVWRGNQYVRAVRLFYQKNGRYPQTLEDLSKPNADRSTLPSEGLQRSHQAADGTWRMIYVSPSGQLIGSVNYLSLQDMALKLGLGIAASGGGNAAANPLTPQPGNAANGLQSGATDPNAQQGSTQAGLDRPNAASPGSPRQHKAGKVKQDSWDREARTPPRSAQPSDSQPPWAS